MSKKIMSRIGRSVSGRPLELDINMKVFDVAHTIAHYTLDEKIDLLCVVEFTIHKRILNDAPLTMDEECLGIMFDYLDRKRMEKVFSDRLDQRGLRTSIDRVRHGKERAF